MTDYPYMISNNKIAPIINKIQQAARPAKFTKKFLKTWALLVRMTGHSFHSQND